LILDHFPLYAFVHFRGTPSPWAYVLLFHQTPPPAKHLSILFVTLSSKLPLKLTTFLFKSNWEWNLASVMFKRWFYLFLGYFVSTYLLKIAREYLHFLKSPLPHCTFTYAFLSPPPFRAFVIFEWATRTVSKIPVWVQRSFDFSKLFRKIDHIVYKVGREIAYTSHILEFAGFKWPINLIWLLMLLLASVSSIIDWYLMSFILLMQLLWTYI